MSQYDWEGLYWETRSQSDIFENLSAKLKGIKAKLLADEKYMSKVKAEGLKNKISAIESILKSKDILKGSLTDDSCVVSLLAKYACFAHIDKPSDEIANDLFEEAMRTINQFDCSFYGKDLVEGQTPVGERAPEKKVCYIQKFPPKERLDKVIAVDTLMNAVHSDSTILNTVCPTTEGMDGLILTVLNLLSEG